MSLLTLLPRRSKLPQALPLTAAATPVVVLHGTNGTAAKFTRLAQALQARGIPVTGVDYAHRGTGDLLAGVREIKSHLLPLLDEAGKVDLIGHSLGGMMALHVAQDPRFTPHIRQIVGLGACFLGMPQQFPGWLRPAVQKLFGPAYVQLEKPGYHPLPQIPQGVRLTSIISTADHVVPASRSRLGRIVTLSQISHGRLPEAVAPIIKALETPFETQKTNE